MGIRGIKRLKTVAMCERDYKFREVSTAIKKFCSVVELWQVGAAEV